MGTNFEKDFSGWEDFVEGRSGHYTYPFFHGEGKLSSEEIAWMEQVFNLDFHPDDWLYFLYLWRLYRGKFLYSSSSRNPVVAFAEKSGREYRKELERVTPRYIFALYPVFLGHFVPYVTPDIAPDLYVMNNYPQMEKLLETIEGSEFNDVRISDLKPESFILYAQHFFAPKGLDIYTDKGLERLIGKEEVRGLPRKELLSYLGEEDHFYLKSGEEPGPCSNGADNYYYYLLEEGPSREPQEEDPLISFGRYKNFLCFFTSELEAAFSFPAPGDEYLETAKFFHPNNPQEEFTEEQARELRGMIPEGPLKDKLTQYLEFVGENAQYLETLSRQFIALPSKEEVVEQLVRLLLLALYMRHWKGYGHPYPYVWREGACQIKREERVGWALAELEDYQRNIPEEDVKFFLSLKILNLNSEGERMKTTSFTLDRFLTVLSEGNFCLSHASDLLLKTSLLYLQFVGEDPQEALNRVVGPMEPLSWEDFRSSRHIDPDQR